MTFRGWCYQLEEYAAALEVAGLAIARLRDPAPSRDDTQYARWHRVPMFFHVRAVEWGVEGKIDRW